MRLLICSILILLLNNGCKEAKQLDRQLLQGTWVAVTILNEGQLDPRDPSEMSLTFYNDDSFTHRSFQNIQTEGTYSLGTDRIYLKANELPEFFIKVDQLSRDTLKIKMNNGKTQHIIYRKINQQ